MGGGIDGEAKASPAMMKSWPPAGALGSHETCPSSLYQWKTCLEDCAAPASHGGGEESQALSGKKKKKIAKCLVI